MGSPEKFLQAERPTSDGSTSQQDDKRAAQMLSIQLYFTGFYSFKYILHLSRGVQCKHMTNCICANICMKLISSCILLT